MSKQIKESKQMKEYQNIKKKKEIEELYKTKRQNNKEKKIEEIMKDDLFSGEKDRFKMKQNINCFIYWIKKLLNYFNLKKKSKNK